MKCNDFHELIDSYLSDELLTETNHSVLRHLEECASCRKVIESRRELRGKLRSAIQSSPEFQINSEFNTNLRNTLRESVIPQKQARNFFWTTGNAWVAVSASLLLVFTFGIWYFQSSEIIPSSAEIVSLTPQIQASYIEDIALGDHSECAVKHSLEERPVKIDLDSPQHIDLKAGALQPLTSSSDKYNFLEAHSCKYQDREFTHLIFETEGKTLSVIMLDLDNQKDSLKNEEIVRFKDSEYQIARFDVNKKAVFVISDLDQQKNSKTAETLLVPMRQRFSTQAQMASISDIARWYR